MKSAKTKDQKAASLKAVKAYNNRQKKDLPILELCILLILEKDFAIESAGTALEKLRRDNVDWNEVRVSSIPEIAEMLTPLKKDPSAIVKVQVLKEFLNQLFNVRHSLNMEFLREESKERQLKVLHALEVLEPYQIDILMTLIRGK